jgi:hypothetical protein
MVALDVCRRDRRRRTRPALCPPRPRQRCRCGSVGTVPAVERRPYQQDLSRSDHIEGELVENRLLNRLGVLANQVNLAVRTAAVVKTHDVTV